MAGASAHSFDLWSPSPQFSHGAAADARAARNDVAYSDGNACPTVWRSWLPLSSGRARRSSSSRRLRVAAPLARSCVGGHQVAHAMRMSLGQYGGVRHEARHPCHKASDPPRLPLPTAVPKLHVCQSQQLHIVRQHLCQVDVVRRLDALDEFFRDRRKGLIHQVRTSQTAARHNSWRHPR